MQYLIERQKWPREIVSFLNSTFEIYEIRGRVGETNGVRFEVRSNEGNHSVAHVHASYGEYAISIRISDGFVLNGKLPPKKQKEASKWVVANKDKLLSDWSNMALSAISSLTKSNLPQL